MKHIPNILTVLRIIFIPFIVYAIINNNFILAIMIFTISSITDILDGIIARKFDFISTFGKLMDPVADKLTQVAITTTLAIEEIISWWIVAFIVLKELIMMSGGLYLYKRKDIVVHSKWFGKVTTVFIYIAVICSFLIEVFPEIGFEITLGKGNVTFDVLLYIIALSFAFFSLLSYIQLFWADAIRKGKKRE